jgi:MscS family membrane protein
MATETAGHFLHGFWIDRFFRFWSWISIVVKCLIASRLWRGRFTSGWLIVFLASAAAAAERDWTSEWDVSWSGGGGRLILEQRGAVVTGSYAPQQGRIEATVTGRRLEGRWIEGNQSGAIVLEMGREGQTFVGRRDELSWWTGRRSSVRGGGEAMVLRSPREALAGFLSAATLARSGKEEAWDRAAQAVVLAPRAEAVTPVQSMEAVRRFFELIDLTTINWQALPVEVEGDTVALRLEQASSGKTLMVKMNRDAAGSWRLVIPGVEEIETLWAALLEVYGDDKPSAQSYLRLQSPRDTMRAFLQGMDDWDGGGRAVVFSTFDLSRIPEIIRDNDGALLAHYLRRALQQIGMEGVQSIPDDRSRRDPYVHFSHSVGSIVIAPSSSEPGAPWRFTSATMDDISELYFAMDQLPAPRAVPLGGFPNIPYFILREQVKEKIPALLRRVNRLELWQVLILAMLVPLAFFIGRTTASVTSRVIKRFPSGGAGQPNGFVWALTILLTGGLLKHIPYLIGIPERSRRYLVPVVGTILFLSAGFVAWHFLSMVAVSLTQRARRTVSRLDDIIVNLVVTGGRIAIVVSTMLAIAYLLSIPSTQILAGLGIGGLAFAIAARETLANFFGAGTIVTDRPFRTGDWISVGTVHGTVEAVGIRSTRIRTADDSVAIIPNGKISDMPILNLGARRHRLIALELLITDGATPDRLHNYLAAVRQRIADDDSFVSGETTIGVHNINKDGITIALRTYVDVRSDSAEIAVRHSLLIDVMILAQNHQLRVGRGLQETTTTS